MNNPKWVEDDRKVIAYFQGLVEKHGDDVKALDWGSRASQVARFSVLAGVGEMRGATVLDVGCGLGDFFDWSVKANLAIDYTGIDITPAMIDHARRRFPSARFEVANLLESTSSPARFDYVVSSGIFNLREIEPREYLRDITSAMFRLCKKAIAFNTLSAWAGHKDGSEFHADPAETLAFCRSLSPHLTLRHDYHPRDFTVYVYKRNAK